MGPAGAGRALSCAKHTDAYGCVHGRDARMRLVTKAGLQTATVMLMLTGFRVSARYSSGLAAGLSRPKRQKFLMLRRVFL